MKTKLFLIIFSSGLAISASNDAMAQDEFVHFGKSTEWSNESDEIPGPETAQSATRFSDLSSTKNPELEFTPDQLRRLARDLRSRHEFQRIEALESLSDAPKGAGALRNLLAVELRSGETYRLLAALDVMRALPDHADARTLLPLLGHDDDAVARATRLVVRAAGIGALSILHEEFASAVAGGAFTPLAVGRARSAIAFESHYALAAILVRAAADPGTCEGRFCDLPLSEDWVIDGLSALASLRDDVVAALLQGTRDAALLAAHEEGRTYWDSLKLSAAGRLDGALDELRGAGIARNPDVAETPTYTRRAARTLLHELRARAVQALAESPRRSRAAALVETLREGEYALRESGERDDSELGGGARPSLLAELDIACARLGRPAALRARIARMRGEEHPTRREALLDDESADAELVEVSPSARIAMLLLRAGEVEEAITEFERLQTREMEAGTLYNLACAYSLGNRPLEALVALKQAVALGYTEYAWMLRDKDLVRLRATDDFVLWFIESAPPYHADNLRRSPLTAPADGAPDRAPGVPDLLVRDSR